MATALTTTMEPRPAAMEGLAAEDFDEIVRQHQRQVYRVLFLLTRDGETADSLTQETFLRAYQGRSSFRGECAVRTWLLRIATNLARDYARSRRASFWKLLVGFEDSNSENRTFDFPDIQASPERNLLARRELDAVWKTALELPQRQKTIFLLRFAEDLPLTEIAAILGVRLGSVKTHLFRAINSVREKMKEQQWR